MTDTTRVTLRIPDEIHEWLREQSFKTRESINSLIVQALENQMENSKMPAITVILSQQDLAEFLDDNVEYMDAYVSELRRRISEYHKTENVEVRYSRNQLTDSFDIDGEPDDGTIAELMNRMVNDWSWLETA